MLVAPSCDAAARKTVKKWVGNAFMDLYMDGFSINQ
jgi:hypothetical protein